MYEDKGRNVVGHKASLLLFPSPAQLRRLARGVFLCFAPAG